MGPAVPSGLPGELPAPSPAVPLLRKELEKLQQRIKEMKAGTRARPSPEQLAFFQGSSTFSSVLLDMHQQAVAARNKLVQLNSALTSAEAASRDAANKAAEASRKVVQVQADLDKAEQAASDTKAAFQAEDTDPAKVDLRNKADPTAMAKHKELKDLKDAAKRSARDLRAAKISATSEEAAAKDVDDKAAQAARDAKDAYDQVTPQLPSVTRD